MGRQTESGRYPSVDCYRYGGPEVPGPPHSLSSEFAGPMLSRYLVVGCGRVYSASPLSPRIGRRITEASLSMRTPAEVRELR